MVLKEKYQKTHERLKKDDGEWNLHHDLSLLSPDWFVRSFYRKLFKKKINLKALSLERKHAKSK